MLEDKVGQTIIKMKKSDFKTSHQEFEGWISWYGDFLYKIVEAKRVIKAKYEKTELVEAFVLKVATVWENLIEEDIITSLNRDSSVYGEYLGLRIRKHLTRDECRAIIVGHTYLDFKSVGNLKNFAKKHLAPTQNPFKAITTQTAKKIDEFMAMRNVIAHYSDFAWRSYMKRLKDKYNYKRVPEPGDFLIAVDPKTTEYRWSKYFRAFLKCSEKMRNSVK